MEGNNFISSLESFDVEFYVAHKEFLNEVEMKVSTIDFEELGI
ncbi:hypothetical protein [Methanobrevibacter thaueri]|uniref:Uncharacterized protein n=1 Tax=Methanobrevibacter thaueri TaxID=190975 RepID=A0A315XNB7_9EURY|nr:hypothetical protein [Methanobrevibacter thaueri]PWB87877.1 hypothetical protein MBBTH_04640 [Methanobrevibacter thaueri]